MERGHYTEVSSPTGPSNANMRQCPSGEAGSVASRDHQIEMLFRAAFEDGSSEMTQGQAPVRVKRGSGRRPLNAEPALPLSELE